MFWNILPENVKGIVAVVETSTGQTTSFQVDGKFVSIESAYCCQILFPVWLIVSVKQNN